MQSPAAQYLDELRTAKNPTAPLDNQTFIQGIELLNIGLARCAELLATAQLTVVAGPVLVQANNIELASRLVVECAKAVGRRMLDREGL